MSLKAKMEAVIYASEEPVTLQQFVSLLGQEAQAELDAAAVLQGQLALVEAEPVVLVEVEPDDQDALNAEVTGAEDFAAVEPRSEANEKPVTETESAPAPESGGDPAAIPTSDPKPGELRARERRLREYMRSVLEGLIAEYAEGDRGLEIREVAGGFRFATKPEYHDAVRGFVRSLKPPLKLSLQALETLAVVAYKQPVTAPEVSEIRGVDSGGVLGSLMARKLVTTAGRKQVIGRPILYKTTKEFLLRFGLKDLAELPSIEEFERMAGAMNEAVQEEIPMAEASTDAARPAGFQGREHEAQADGIPDAGTGAGVDDERTTRPPSGPGEFTGNETAPPADNAAVDGRISGVPPDYTNADNPSAQDAEVQSEQMGNAGEDD